MIALLDYASLKPLHAGLALASGTLFALRGAAMWRGSAWSQIKPVRGVSVAIDSLLLLAALLLLARLQAPLQALVWLQVKLLLLLAYIVLGSLALKRAASHPIRRLCLLAALLCYLQMIGIALSKSPWGWISRWVT